MSATIIFDNRNYVSRLEQAGFTRMQAEAQTEVLTEYSETLRAALQPLLRFYEETAHKDLATKGDVLDTRLEIEKVRAEVEKVRADLKVDIETTRAEVEKVRADLKVDIEKVRADLKVDIENTRVEVEKVRAEVEKVRADAEKNKFDLLKWQIGIGIALVAIMAKGFGWLGF